MRTYWISSLQQQDDGRKKNDQSEQYAQNDTQDHTVQTHEFDEYQFLDGVVIFIHYLFLLNNLRRGGR
jgi:hypothetical protein